MTAEGLREKARELEIKLGDPCEHSSDCGLCSECRAKLFIRAMARALEEAERAVREHAHCEESPANCATHILDRLASLRSELGSGPEGE